MKTFLDKATDIAFYSGWRPRVVHYSGSQVYNIWLESIMIDPLFWQAIGKGLKWEEKEVVLNLSEKIISSVGRDDFKRKQVAVRYTKKIKDRWKREMRNFTNHIIDGKEMEAFFKNLIKEYESRYIV